MNPNYLFNFTYEVPADVRTAEGVKQQIVNRSGSYPAKTLEEALAAFRAKHSDEPIVEIRRGMELGT